MDLAGSPGTVTVSGSMSISVEGEDRCGSRIFGGGSFASMTVPRTLLLPDQGIVRYSVLSQCGSHNITGIIGCTNRRCVTPRNCTTPGCDAPAIRDQVTDARPWFADTSQVTNVAGLECAGISYSYPFPTCEFSNPAFASQHQTAVPGQLAVYPLSASLESVQGSQPCAIRAAISLGVRNYRAVTECQNFQTVWYWPQAVCPITGFGAIYRKLCQQPGDTILGTYIRDGGEDTEICTHTEYDTDGNFLYTITVQRTYGASLTVS